MPLSVLWRRAFCVKKNVLNKRTKIGEKGAKSRDLQKSLLGKRLQRNLRELGIFGNIYE